MAEETIILGWAETRKALMRILDQISLASILIIAGMDIASTYGVIDIEPASIIFALIGFGLVMAIEARRSPFWGLKFSDKLARLVVVGALSALIMLPGNAISTIVLTTIGIIKIAKKI